MKTLETNRLILRQYLAEDYKDVYEYASNPLVGPNAGWSVHESEEETKKLIEMFISEDEAWAIVLKDTNKMIGSIGAHKRNSGIMFDFKQREIGYVLNPSFWGNGYITEAIGEVIRFLFEEQKLDLITVGHFDFNERSQKVIVRNGFRYSHNKMAILPLIGKEYNTLVYVMTKDMYYAKYNFLKMIDDRFSVRNFSDKNITKEELDSILNSGRIAPTAVNFQPQKIIVVKDPDLLEKLNTATKTYFNAKTILVVCHDKNLSWHRKSDNKDHGIIDASIVATYMMLTATSLGIGSCYVSSFKDAVVRETLNIPENYEVNCLLPIGYIPNDVIPSESHFNRKDIKDIVFYDSIK